MTTKQAILAVGLSPEEFARVARAFDRRKAEVDNLRAARSALEVIVRRPVDGLIVRYPDVGRERGDEDQILEPVAVQVGNFGGNRAEGSRESAQFPLLVQHEVALRQEVRGRERTAAIVAGQDHFSAAQGDQQVQVFVAIHVA